VWVGDLDQTVSDLLTKLGLSAGSNESLRGFGARNAKITLESSFVEFASEANPVEARSNRYGRLFIERWQRAGDGPSVFVMRTPVLERVLAHCKGNGGLCETSMVGGTTAPWLSVFMPGTEPVFLDPRLPNLGIPRSVPYLPAGDHPIGARALSGVVIAVADLNEALKLYSIQLALEPDPIEERDGARTATFRIDHDRQRIVAVEGKPQTDVYDHVQSKGEGIFAVLLAVRSLKQALRKLKSGGVSVTHVPWLDHLPATDPKAAAGTRFVLWE
jgi:hypothetical protein